MEQQLAEQKQQIGVLRERNSSLSRENDALTRETKQRQQELEQKILAVTTRDPVFSGDPIIQELKQRQAVLLKDNEKLMQLNATRLAEACKALEKKVDDVTIRQLVTEMNSYRIALDGLQVAVGTLADYKEQFLNMKIHVMYMETRHTLYRDWVDLLRQGLRNSNVDSTRLDQLMGALEKANRAALIQKAAHIKIQQEREAEVSRLTGMLSAVYDEAKMMDYSSRDKLPKIADVGRSVRQIEEKLTEKKALEARLKQYRARMEIAEREAWGYKALNSRLESLIATATSKITELSNDLRLAEPVARARATTFMELKKELNNKLAGFEVAIDNLPAGPKKTKLLELAKQAYLASLDKHEEQFDEKGRMVEMQSAITMLDLVAIPEVYLDPDEQKGPIRDKYAEMKAQNRKLMSDIFDLSSDLEQVIAFVLSDKQQVPDVLRNFAVEAFDRPENAFPRILRAEANAARAQVRLKTAEIAELQRELKEAREQIEQLSQRQEEERKVRLVQDELQQARAELDESNQAAHRELRSMLRSLEEQQNVNLVAQSETKELLQTREELKEIIRSMEEKLNNVTRFAEIGIASATILGQVAATLKELSMEEEHVPMDELPNGFPSLFTELKDPRAWDNNVGLIFDKLVARAREVRGFNGQYNPNDTGILQEICRKLRVIAAEEKDLPDFILADQTSNFDEEKKGLPKLLIPWHNDGQWTGYCEKIFDALLYRARRIRVMKIVPSTHEFASVVQQLYRLRIPVTQFTKLLTMLEPRERNLDAETIMRIWSTAEQVGRAKIAQQKAGMAAILSVWRGFTHLLQNIMDNVSSIRDRFPEYSLEVPDMKVQGNFTLAIQNWANWANIPRMQKWEYLKGLAEMLGDTDFTRLFNAEFRNWLRAAEPILLQMTPDEIRPDASFDMKMQTAVDTISESWRDEFKRFSDKLDTKAKTYSDKVIEDISVRMMTASLDKLHNLREAMNRGEMQVDLNGEPIRAVNTATVEAILHALYLQFKPNNAVIPINLINEQQRRYEMEQEVKWLVQEGKRRNEELKDCEELRRKADQFIRAMMKLVNADEKAAPRLDPDGELQSRDLWFSTIESYFSSLAKRYSAVSKSLERLKDATGDMAVKLAIERVLRKRDGGETELDALDKLLAENAAVGIGTAAYQRPITNVELQVAGEQRMAIWDSFTGNLTFGSIYGFAGVVAGFLNRSEETLMVQLVPGVDTGSTNYWLIMGRIEDELKVNVRDRVWHEQQLHLKREGLQFVQENIELTRNDPEQNRLWIARKEQVEKEIEELKRRIRHHAVTTNANHVDVRAFEEKLAVLLPEQRENMKKELQERRDIQMRIAIESLYRLTQARDEGPDKFVKEALFFYKPQLKAAIFKSFELLRTIPQVDQARLWELISEQRVATRFAALVANTIKAIELQTDAKTFDQTLFRILNNEQRSLVSEFQYGLKRKRAGDWEVVVQKRDKFEDDWF